MALRVRHIAADPELMAAANQREVIGHLVEAVQVSRLRRACRKVEGALDVDRHLTPDVAGTS